MKRKKLSDKTQKRLVRTLLVLLILLALSCIYVNRVHSQPDLEWTSYRVRPGDTISGLGMRYCPDSMGLRDWQERVMETNHCTSLIQPGQELRILVEVE